MQGPDTQASLLARLNDPSTLNDSSVEDAWGLFVPLYRPLILRVAQAKGLQPADAEDLAQEVLTTVERSISSFESEGHGSFRRWLKQVTRNLVINYLTRGKEQAGTGDSNIQHLLQQHPDPNCKAATLFDVELRRLRFQHAATIVKQSVSETTWQCFYLTTVLHESIADVAAKLHKTPGSIRVARCRVLAKIRDEVSSDDIQ